MEQIRLSGYILEENRNCLWHLLPEAIEMRVETFSTFSPKTALQMIDGYAREAGVRA